MIREAFRQYPRVARLVAAEVVVLIGLIGLFAFDLAVRAV